MTASKLGKETVGSTLFFLASFPGLFLNGPKETFKVKFKSCCMLQTACKTPKMLPRRAKFYISCLWSACSITCAVEADELPKAMQFSIFASFFGLSFLARHTWATKTNPNNKHLLKEEASTPPFSAIPLPADRACSGSAPWAPCLVLSGSSAQSLCEIPAASDYSVPSRKTEIAIYIVWAQGNVLAPMARKLSTMGIVGYLLKTFTSKFILHTWEAYYLFQLLSCNNILLFLQRGVIVFNSSIKL